LNDLKNNKGIHESRNSTIARVLREAGYMRELGEGIRRIFALMKMNELAPPDFFSENNKFGTILHHKFIYTQDDKLWLGQFNDNLSREEKTIVLLGKNGHQISPTEIWDAVGITDTEYYRQLIESLYQKEILERIKSKSTVHGYAKKHGLSSKDVAQFAIINPGEAKKQKRASNEQIDQDEYAKIFVGNIPYGSKPNELTKLFSSFGNVVSVQLPVDSVTGFQRGFAFIEFAKKSDAEKVLKFQEPIVFENRPLYIKEYLKKF
jgi:ATP-dependent DNA helicase RecG